MEKYQGLTSKQAEELLAKNGKNALKEEKGKTLLQMILSNLISATNIVMAFAIILTIFMGDYGETLVISIIVLANLIVSVIQENKAQKAVEALKKLTKAKATVFRDGEEKEIDSEDLVVGDYVLLEAGKQIPADLRLIETINLTVDEKALTGESVPVTKDCRFVPVDDTIGIGDRLDLGYMSTIVATGRGIGIVEKVGMNTEIGKIADMVGKEKDKKSPLEEAMEQFSKVLGIICVIVCVIVFIIGMLQGRDILEMLKISVSLAVASIPEGIPTIVTIVLALGMQKMAKSNAIVKTLAAVETLGSVSYVCSDKTGTLTQNKMTVKKAFNNLKYVDLDTLDIKENELLINGLLLCNDSVITKTGEEIGDPTEVALVSLAKRYNIEKSDREKDMPRINELAFDSDRKLMTTVHTMNERLISFTKGSTDELLCRCTKILENGKVRKITNDDFSKITNAMAEMSNEALRVLSLAIRYDIKETIEQDLIYVGMVGMIDPERKEVVESIKTFKRAGIKTVMITGDHKDTALAIAKNLGIANSPNECIMGHELDKLSDEALQHKIKDLSIFARVSPEHKVRIVKAIQANGFIASMTGDGVNDAPSLKAANVGVAMGITGTDVAKGAADIILQDDLFTTIEKAIHGGRNIFENLRKSIVFALSSNISEIITMFLAILAGFATPLQSMHILWVNLLTDSLPCFALGVDPNSSSDVMNKPPRKANESLFAHGGTALIIIYGILIAMITLGGFVFTPINYLLDNNMSITISNISSALEIESILMKSQTLAFSVLAITELFHAIGMRDVDTSIFKFKLFDNKTMILAFVVGLLAQLAVTEIPFLTTLFDTVSLSVVEWVGIILVSMIPLVMHEIIVVVKKLSTKRKNS